MHAPVEISPARTVTFAGMPAAVRISILRSSLIALLASAALAACASTPDEPTVEPSSEDALVSDVTTADVSPEVLVKDPRTIAQLEASFSAAQILGGSGASLAELAATSPAFRDLAAAVRADITVLKSSDRDSGKGFAFGHRLFEDAWLTWDKARLELVGLSYFDALDGAGFSGRGELVCGLFGTLS